MAMQGVCVAVLCYLCVVTARTHDDVRAVHRVPSSSMEAIGRVEDSETADGNERTQNLEIEVSDEEEDLDDKVDEPLVESATEAKDSVNIRRGLDEESEVVVYDDGDSKQDDDDSDVQKDENKDLKQKQSERDHPLDETARTPDEITVTKVSVSGISDQTIPTVAHNSSDDRYYSTVPEVWVWGQQASVEVTTKSSSEMATGSAEKRIRRQQMGFLYLGQASEGAIRGTKYDRIDRLIHSL